MPKNFYFMRKHLFVYVFLLIIGLSGCGLNNKQTIIASYPPALTADELSYLPYSIGDTVSFINSAGDHLKYVCRTYVHERDPFPSRCNDPNVSSCTKNLYDHLNISLRIATGTSTYNTPDIYLYVIGDTSGYAYMTLSANASLTVLFDNSACKLQGRNGALVTCLSTLTVNSKTFTDVTKIEYNNTTINNFYVAKDYGIIQFTANNAVWMRDKL